MNKQFIILTLLLSFSLPCSNAQTAADTTTSNQPKRINNRKKTKTYAFDFDNKPLVDIINELAALKNINIILPQGALAIPTKVTYHLPKPIPVKQAWKLLMSILTISNYTIRPDGDMQLIVKTDTPNITRETFNIYIDEPLDKLPNTEEIITAMFYLANLNIKNMQNDLQAVMQDMLSPNLPNNIKWDPKTNSVILTDKSILIKNVMKIIKELDQTGLRDTIEVLPLYYTSAQVIDDLFNKQLFAPAQPTFNGGGAQPTPQASYFPRNTKIMALERANSVVIMGTSHAIDLVKDFIIKYLDRPLESGESILHIYNLKYLTAAELQPVLQNILTPGGGQQQAAGKTVGPKQYFKDVIVVAEISKSTEELQPSTPGGESTASAPTTQGSQLGGNRLIIAARGKDWTRIKKLIDDLDKPQPQIALEVLVVDLTLESNKLLGTQLRNPGGFHDVLSKNVNFQSAQLASPVLTPLQNPIPFVDGAGQTADQFPANALMSNLLQLNADTSGNLATGAIPGSLVIALKDTGIDNVWGLFFLLDSFANTTILAQPFLVTQNHQQATVTIQQTRFLQMSAEANAAAVNVPFESSNAGLTVDILPHISSINNTISLQVTVNVNEFIDNPQNLNNKITRLVQTSATVGNGEILALGGLIRERDILNVTKVPILGDIPILGWFLKKEQKQRQKNNLLIFIAPTIIKPRLAGGIDPFTCQKLEYAENEIDEHLVFENLRDPITRWFFQPDPTKAQRTLDSFTHHSLHVNADVRHDEELAAESQMIVKNEQKTASFDADATNLKQLVQNEENPLLRLEQKQL